MLLFNCIFLEVFLVLGFLGFYLGFMYIGIFYIDGGGLGGLFLLFFDWDCCLERYCIVNNGEFGILMDVLCVDEGVLSFFVVFVVLVNFVLIEFIFWR